MCFHKPVKLLGSAGGNAKIELHSLPRGSLRLNAYEHTQVLASLYGSRRSDLRQCGLGPSGFSPPPPVCEESHQTSHCWSRPNFGRLSTYCPKSLPSLQGARNPYIGGFPSGTYFVQKKAVTERLSDCCSRVEVFETMRVILATTCILAGSLLAGGCATKKYVRNTTAPIQAKVDQVGTQTTQNSQQIEDTKGQLKQADDKAQSGINAAQERASAADQHAAAADQHAGVADQHATDAMNKAKQAGDMADANNKDLNKLRSVVANIDDYKMQTSASVPFAFDKFALTASAKEDLDKLAGSLGADKHFVISVEGYTDSTGNKAYNEALSRKRADAVVTYLVAKHDVPIYRIHMIGLGEDKPVDEGKNRAARAKNRRVEVKVFGADVDAGTATTSTAGQNQ